MAVYTLARKQTLPISREEVFSFFGSPENLALITPPWLGFEILTPLPIAMKVGALVDYTIRWLGFPVRWTTLITTYDPPFRFVDEQIRGPYSLWHHVHTFAETAGGTDMTDTVSYVLPFGLGGRIVHALIVRKQLEQIFEYRARMISAIFHERGSVRDVRQSGARITQPREIVE